MENYNSKQLEITNDNHIDKKIGACRSFYSLQSARMCKKGVHINLEIYTVQYVTVSA